MVLPRSLSLSRLRTAAKYLSRLRKPRLEEAEHGFSEEGQQGGGTRGRSDTSWSRREGRSGTSGSRREGRRETSGSGREEMEYFVVEVRRGMEAKMRIFLSQVQSQRLSGCSEHYSIVGEPEGREDREGPGGQGNFVIDVTETVPVARSLHSHPDLLRSVIHMRSLWGIISSLHHWQRKYRLLGMTVCTLAADGVTVKGRPARLA